MLPQQASGYHECTSAGMAASIATTITAVRIAETLICRSLSLHQLRKLIIVLSHECNIFLELNRLCALERGIKLLQILFLFYFQYRFVGFNRVDLLLDLFRWLGEFFGLLIDAGHNHGDIH